MCETARMWANELLTTEPFIIDYKHLLCMAPQNSIMCQGKSVCYSGTYRITAKMIVVDHSYQSASTVKHHKY